MAVISLTDLAKMAHVSMNTVHRDMQRELFCATYQLIRRKDKRGRNNGTFGWVVSRSEAAKYCQYRASLVGFRSDGTLPTAKVLAMLESGMTPEDVAKEAKIKPSSVKRILQRAESLRKRRELWQGQVLNRVVAS